MTTRYESTDGRLGTWAFLISDVIFVMAARWIPNNEEFFVGLVRLFEASETNLNSASYDNSEFLFRRLDAHHAPENFVNSANSVDKPVWSNKVLDWSETLDLSVRKVCRMKQSFCCKQRRQRGWNDFSTSSYYTRSRRTVKLNFETRDSQMTFLLSTIYPSALVIISLPTPKFHCMFTWLPSLLCISCAGGTKSERQRRPEQVEPCTDCPFTSEISVKREHRILIPVICYFYFLIFLIRA